MNAVVEEEAVAEGKLEQLRPEQRASHPSNNDLSDNTAITNWGYFILFSYLYLLQGIVSGIIGTTPYIYAQLPDYNTMALFGANLLPFSFKFVLGSSPATQRPSSKSTSCWATESAKRGW